LTPSMREHALLWLWLRVRCLDYRGKLRPCRGPLATHTPGIDALARLGRRVSQARFTWGVSAVASLSVDRAGSQAPTALFSSRREIASAL
jgi:hypothetical protein